MGDIVERLRFEMQNKHYRIMEEAAVEIERLRRAMHDIYEVYAGSEGFPAPQTCSEAYLLNRLMEMVAIAAEHKHAAKAALEG